MANPLEKMMGPEPTAEAPKPPKKLPPLADTHGKVDEVMDAIEAANEETA